MNLENSRRMMKFFKKKTIYLYKGYYYKKMIF